ncbi:MAG: hypothetical protein HKM05_04670 [Spirochaetales bacterium]|nr:hypothetical protein [Spirochaetales bacterium]
MVRNRRLASAGLVVLWGLVITACAPVPRYNSVYLWKADVDWTPVDTALLARDGVSTVYLHIGDWDESAGRNVGEKLTMKHPLPRQFSVIPVLYLTVATLNSWAQTPLTPHVSQERAQACLAIFDSFPRWTRSAHDWQIDADWNPSNRDAYFSFLREFKTLLKPGDTLSVTIRLSQYRDRLQEGVPPVDRGVLLTYGAGDPRNPASRVLDPRLVAQYVRPGDRYPLPIDVALPEYGEVRQFNPFDRLVALTTEPNGTSATAAELGWPAGLIAWPQRGPGWAQADRRVFWADLVWMEGDRALVDAPSPEQDRLVLQSIRQTGSALGGRLILFAYSRDEWRTARHEAFTSALR